MWLQESLPCNMHWWELNYLEDGQLSAGSLTPVTSTKSFLLLPEDCSKQMNAGRSELARVMTALATLAIINNMGNSHSLISVYPDALPSVRSTQQTYQGISLFRAKRRIMTWTPSRLGAIGVQARGQRLMQMRWGKCQVWKPQRQHGSLEQERTSDWCRLAFIKVCRNGIRAINKLF
jgi:hypothetical protein